MLHHEMLKRQCSFPNIQHGKPPISWKAQRASYFCNSFLMLWESCAFTFTLAKQFKLVPPPPKVSKKWDHVEFECFECITITSNPQYASCTSNFPKIHIWSPIGRLWQWTQVLLTIFMDAPLEIQKKKWWPTCDMILPTRDFNKHALISLHLPNIDQTLIMVAGITTINQSSFLSSR